MAPDTPTVPVFTVSRLLAQPDLVDATAAELGGAFHLGGVGPDAALDAAHVAELVAAFRDHVPGVDHPDPAEGERVPVAAREAWQDEYDALNAEDAVRALHEPPDGATPEALASYEAATRSRKTVIAEAAKLGLLPNMEA